MQIHRIRLSHDPMGKVGGPVLRTPTTSVCSSHPHLPLCVCVCVYQFGCGGVLFFTFQRETNLLTVAPSEWFFPNDMELFCIFQPWRAVSSAQPLSALGRGHSYSPNLRKTYSHYSSCQPAHGFFHQFRPRNTLLKHHTCYWALVRFI